MNTCKNAGFVGTALLVMHLGFSFMSHFAVGFLLQLLNHLMLAVGMPLSAYLTDL